MDAKSPLSANLSHIIEPKARTTFENALYCSQIIKSEKFKKVLLVTSDFHLPRALFLLKTMLIGSKVQVLPVEARPNNRADTDFKLIYDETVCFWGSIGEMIFYAIIGRTPEYAPKDWPVVRYVKNTVLFHPL